MTAPQDISALLLEASKAHVAGRLRETELLCATVLQADCENVQALLLCGVVAAKKSDAVKAIDLLTRVASSDPASFHAHLWLSMVYRKIGQTQQALKFAIIAVGLSAADPQGQNQLGSCYLDLYQYADAEVCFRKALQLAPQVPVIHYSLGLALRGLKQSAEAIGAFRRAAELDPNNLATQVNIREALMNELDAAGAAECARRIVALQPDSAEAHLWLARTLMEDNKAAEAEPLIKRALQLEPESGLAHTLFGSLYQGMGRMEEADASFARSIDIAPKQGSAYQALAYNRKIGEADRPLLNRMKALMSDRTLSRQHLSQLCYAVGKASEDLGEYKEAMSSFEEANRLAYEVKFGGVTFNRELHKANVEFMLDKFGNLAGHEDIGLSSALPILVVGMMRSGTTLVEQILSSHPQVGPAGEQRFWLDHAAQVLNQPSVDPARVKSLAEEYCSLLQSLAPGKPRVVDKMPGNHSLLGLIHLALPLAKIIHITRNPLDTSISIFATPNRTRIEWAHDKGNIAFAFEQYLRLMEHWRRVLPAGAMMEVSYEHLVADQQGLTRRMVEFCGLDWDDACLRPESNNRSVVTPSVWQVRQPVYKTSVERWRRFEPWLGPLGRLREIC